MINQSIIKVLILLISTQLIFNSEILLQILIFIYIDQS